MQSRFHRCLLKRIPERPELKIGEIEELLIFCMSMRIYGQDVSSNAFLIEDVSVNVPSGSAASLLSLLVFQALCKSPIHAINTAVKIKKASMVYFATFGTKLLVFCNYRSLIMGNSHNSSGHQLPGMSVVQ